MIDREINVSLKRSILLFAVLAFLIPEPIAAQGSWVAATRDLGAQIYGSAGDPTGTLGFHCTAPSPQGRDPIETGEHESHETGPYAMYVSFRDSLFTWHPPYRIDGASIVIGQQGFRLPSIQLDELSGTAVHLSMSDPLVPALLQAPSVVLDTGQGKAYRFAVAGLKDALKTAFGYCAARWAELGFPLPPQIAGLELVAVLPDPAASAPGRADTGYAPIRSSTLPPGYRLAPLRPLPAEPPAAGSAHLTALCQGAWTSDPAYVQSADIDGDGIQDFVLNWSGVTCEGALRGRAFCGAANCRIDVFLSRRGYADPEELLGVAADIVMDGKGRVGVLLSGTGFLCSDGACSSPFYWNGTTLSQQE